MNRDREIQDLHKKTWTDPHHLHPHTEHIRPPRRHRYLYRQMEFKTAFMILVVSVLTGLVIAFISEQMTKKARQSLTAPGSSRDQMMAQYKDQAQGLVGQFKEQYGDDYKSKLKEEYGQYVGQSGMSEDQIRSYLK